MEVRKGIGVSGGYAIAEAVVLDREEYRIPRRSIGSDEIDSEGLRLAKAFEEGEKHVRDQIQAIPRRLRDVAGTILEAELSMLRDAHLQDQISSEIKRYHYAAEYAASRVLKRKIKSLEDTGKEAFVQRVRSVLVGLEKDILRSLLGSRREDIAHLTGDVVVVAHDLTPAQTIGLDRKWVKGLLTEAGGPTSHTAIIARSLGIPAVIGVSGVTNDVVGGDTLIIDGESGTVIIDPDETTLKRFRAKADTFNILDEKLTKETRDLPAITKDGQRIKIHANIEKPEEIESALAHGAEGIGLYRTEFLYLDHGFAPSEQQHLEAYRLAVRHLDGKPLTIRTMDLGADKMPVDGLPREDNPFLGTRAIRLCRERPDIWTTQLRAILKVANIGNVGMMVPMISSLSEIQWVREDLGRMREELQREGDPSGEGMELGIMIEVPSAAIMVDQLAPHVDFMSVGTNDLIQYAVAVDRRNERVAPLYQPAHPAILQLLRMTIEAGVRHNKPVSICGEMSSEIIYTLLLLGMGLRTFSVVPPVIPEIKKIIRSVTMDHAREVAKKAFTFDDPRTTVQYLREETRKILPDAF